MSPTKRMRKSPEDTTGFSEAELAAMRERAQEQRAGRSARTTEAVLARIAELPPEERELAERIHTLIVANTPQLSPRLWYGMPAYAKDGRVVCFFQSAHKFQTRYATLGFNDAARLDDGEMWPVAFAVCRLTPEVEARIGELVRRAVRD